MTEKNASISVYYIKHQSLAQNCSKLMALPLLPSYIHQYHECKNPKAALCPLASAFLLYRILGLSEDGQLVRAENGKPYCSNGSIYFSLSHDNGLTVLSTASFEHGIDVEKLTAPRLNVADRVFPECYKEELNQYPDEDTFTRLWTQTEAILKAEGTGFTHSLKDHPQLLGKWQTQSLLLEDCRLSAAAEKDFLLLAPVEVSFSL